MGDFDENEDGDLVSERLLKYSVKGPNIDKHLSRRNGQQKIESKSSHNSSFKRTNTELNDRPMRVEDIQFSDTGG